MRATSAVALSVLLLSIAGSALGALTTTMRFIPQADINGSVVTEASALIDASGEKAASVFVVEHAGDITAITFRLGTVTEEDTLRVSLQNVDASGDPDGTADQSCTVTFTDADDNTFQSCTLGAARTVTPGDIVAVVIDYNSYADGNLNINYPGSSFARNTYRDHYTTSWAKSTSSGMLAYLSYGGTYYESTFSAEAVINGASINTGTTPDEIALLWAPTVDCTLSGAMVGATLNNSADIVLYDSGSSALSTYTITAVASDSASTRGWYYIPFGASGQSITSGSTYRIAIKPTSASSVTPHYAVTPSAAARVQIPGGATGQYSARTDAGAWSETAANLTLIIPICSQYHATSGGGSGGVRVLDGGILQ